MKSIETRIYSAAAAAAAEVTGADVPPLRLRARRAGWWRRRGEPAFRGVASPAFRGVARPAGTRRWAAALAAAASVVIVIAAVLAAGRGPDAGRHAGSRPAAPPGVGHAHGHGSMLPAEALDWYFPASGAQYTTGLAFEWTRLKISARIFDRCMARAGFPQQPFTGAESAYLMAFPDNSQFPDLAQRSRLDSMSGPPYISPNPTPPPSAAGRAAYRRCTALSDRPFTAIDRLATPLQNRWLGTVTAVQTSARVNSMQPAFAACLQASGIPAAYAQQQDPQANNPLFTGFFGWMDHLGQTSTSTGQSTAEDHRWTPVFVRCAGPTVNLIERLQARQRAALFARHAMQVRRIEALAAGLAAPGH